MPIIKSDSQEYKDWLAGLKVDDVVGIGRSYGYGPPNPYEPLLAPYTVRKVTPKRLWLDKKECAIDRALGRAMNPGNRFSIYPWRDTDLVAHRAWKERNALDGMAPYLMRRLSNEGVAAVLKIIRTDPEWLKIEAKVKP